MVSREPRRKDINVIKINATDIARELGNIRVANIVSLGALIKKTGLLKMTSVARAIEELFSKKKAGLIEINKKALKEGAKGCN